VDYGKGISDEKSEKIFDPYFNSDLGKKIERRKEKEVHVGFGLNLA